MAIREDLVVSAAQFLQDPSVAASPIEKRIAFLQAKNLTQEEVSAALARVGQKTSPAPSYASSTASYPVAQQQQPPQQQPPQPYYGQQYPQQYPPYAWQPPPQEVPRRDWRDWFIMATVVGGVSYGLFNLGKRYIYPLVAPPTPDRLEQDKKSIDEQFEQTFTLVEQLAKDTEALKAAEQERTERLDTALGELESVLTELKSANRRRDDEAQRVRDDVLGLKDAVPRALNNQKDLTDTRLREVNAELKSLKTLITQRMNPTATSTSVGNYLRPSSGNATPASVPAVSSSAATPIGGSEITGNVNGHGKAASVEDEPKFPQSASSSIGRSSPFSSGMSGAAKASIPAWQMMAAKGASSSSTAVTNGAVDTGSGDGQGTFASP
ncbi:peroxisomal membrane anchor protein conserved region-domain-containing protein [Lasiosphaeris hirsuta]|uniref:Peroxisomal membrane protein PEX14 n=1 Tax=Lasiosphaeris hirsuta TaxID=260670 RepID=A0AA40A2R9_9PEZI|nr:peroxisomal membrane anchor protein conserved region-domain-containing protein [Lasiosphaeris hirsuta]